MTENEITTLRSIAAFLMAGVYVATMARIAERFGSKLGGLLLALPSTVFVGISFIAWSEGHEGLRAASTVLPATIAAATIFLTVFIRLSHRGLLASYLGAIVVWLAITVPLAVVHLESFAIAMTLSVALFAVSIYAFRHVPHRSARPIEQSWMLLLIRFSVAGFIAGATVIVARLAGPVWGAVCASFPAVFSASLFLMTRSQGIEFTTSLGRTMIVGCMANVVFAIAIRVLSASMGSPQTIALAYLCTLAFGLVAYRFLIEMLGRNQPSLPPRTPSRG